MKKTILLVPGFVADTYSEIERSFVELSAHSDAEIQLLWLVPEISAKGNSFARKESRTLLREPAYVPHLREHHVPYVVGNISPYNIIGNYLLFRKIFKEYDVEGVYTHFGFERFWATLFAKVWRKKTIWNEHWHSLGRRYSLLKRLFYRLFVDEFISISKFISSTLPQHCHIHTIPNAIHVRQVPQKNPSELLELRKRLGIPATDKVVLMVAAFRLEKRHMLALEVCERVLHQRQDVFFVFLGGGELRSSFAAEVIDRGLSQYIIAPGYVDNVNDYYAISDISILTSHNEPFGYVVLEAMRYELPVVAFNNGGPSEVIRNNETGKLIEENDVEGFAAAVLELLGEKNKCRSMGAQAAKVVMLDYNRDVWISRIFTVLRSCTK